MSRIVRIGDVAAHAGVSSGTVSNVINRPDIVRVDTRERVESAMQELGYVPNLVARQLRQGRSRTIGLIVLDLANPFYTDLARGASAAAESSGNTVLIASSEGDAAREVHLLRTFAEQRVRGVLLSPSRAQAPGARMLNEGDIPVVLVDGTPGMDAFAGVRSDHERGGALAVQNLIDTGCARIVCLSSTRSLPQVDARLVGACAAGTRADIPIVTVRVAGVGIADGMAAVDQVVAAKSDGPLGVFATTDVLAFGLVQGLQRAGGLRIPTDVRIVGYDGIDLSATSVPSISTVRQRAPELGSRAVRMLEEMISGKDLRGVDVALLPELVERESSGISHL